MNSRKVLLNYAKELHGKEAIQYIKVEWNNVLQCDTLHTKDSKGNLERCNIDYKQLYVYIMKNFKLEEKEVQK